ncbi:hypothetical protein Slin15195_G100310 [Septoria linicola]|uniref:Uncharacterized protein n=1 Tax=Septoria linicola TaxID=215465 RepID=A0A9Q9B3G0_9PEZI|nr:hypothetical protein Slin15195_G100310 [Septoria linicola]
MRLYTKTTFAAGRDPGQVDETILRHTFSQTMTTRTDVDGVEFNISTLQQNSG